MNENQKRKREAKRERRARIKQHNVPGAERCACGHAKTLHENETAACGHCPCSAFLSNGRFPHVVDDSVTRTSNYDRQHTLPPEGPLGPVTEDMLTKLEGKLADMEPALWTEGNCSHNVATVDGVRVADFAHGVSAAGVAYLKNCAPALIAEIRRLKAGQPAPTCGDPARALRDYPEGATENSCLDCRERFTGTNQALCRYCTKENEG